MQNIIPLQLILSLIAQSEPNQIVHIIPYQDLQYLYAGTIPNYKKSSEYTEKIELALSKIGFNKNKNYKDVQILKSGYAVYFHSIDQQNQFVRHYNNTIMTAKENKSNSVSSKPVLNNDVPNKKNKVRSRDKNYTENKAELLSSEDLNLVQTFIDKNQFDDLNEDLNQYEDNNSEIIDYIVNTLNKDVNDQKKLCDYLKNQANNNKLQPYKTPNQNEASSNQLKQEDKDSSSSQPDVKFFKVTGKKENTAIEIKEDNKESDDDGFKSMEIVSDSDSDDSDWVIANNIPKSV